MARLSRNVHFAGGIVLCRVAGCTVDTIDGAPMGEEGRRGGRPSQWDPVDYRERHAVEYPVNHPRRNRALITRCDGLAVRYEATALVAAINEWL